LNKNLLSVSATFFLLAVIFAPLMASPLPTPQPGEVIYQNFTDPGSEFVMQYPKDLLTPMPPTSFVSRDNSTRMEVYVSNDPDYDNKTWEWEYDDCLDEHLKDEVTYKVLKKNFLVISGYNRQNIYYEKIIPVENNGNRYLITFNVQFPRIDREQWEPVLARCAESLKLSPRSIEKGASLGWDETAENKMNYETFRLAKKWLDQNLKCSDSTQDNNGPSANLNLNKCMVDDRNILFFNAKSSPAIQFVLPVHAPGDVCGQLFAKDFKYVLFTYEGQRLRGEIIHQITEGERPWCFDLVDVIDVTKNEKLLSLRIGGDRGRSTAAEIFRYIHGQIKKVLEYENWADETTPGQGDGMESLLLPQTNGDLRLFKHKWERDFSKTEEDEDSNATIDRYSEMFFRFDPIHEKYLQVGEEKDVPTRSAEIEWKKLSD
jgi:hypothetical protein